MAQGCHASSAVALEDSEVCVVPFSRLEGLSREIQTLQSHFHRVMSREIVRDHQVMMLLGTMRAEERLAAFLLNLFSKTPGARSSVAGKFGTPLMAALGMCGKEGIAALRESALAELAPDFQPEPDEGLRAFNVDRIYAGEVRTGDELADKVASIVTAAHTLPMMAPRRVVRVTSPLDTLAFEPVNQYALQVDRFSRYLRGERVPVMLSGTVFEGGRTLSGLLSCA